MRKKAIVSGAFGQDAKFMTDLLFANSVDVILVYRYSSVPLAERAKNYELDKVFHMECVDIGDPTGVNEIVEKYRPDYIFNLAAQSHVGQSFKDPQTAFHVNTFGVLNWLEAIRRLSPESRFLQASTSEMWGSNYTVSHGVYFENDEPKITSTKIQNEETPFSPNSPYAAAKLAAHNLCRIYRESYNIFACTSICHNHECFHKHTPIIIKDKYGMLDVRYISDLISTHDEKNNDIKYYNNEIQVWNGEDWTNIKAISYKRLKNLKEEDRKIVFTRTKNGLVLTTPNHNFINSNGEKIQQKKLIKEKTNLKLGAFPKLENNVILTKEFAMFLGLLVGDGHVNKNGSSIRFVNNKKQYRDLFIDVAKKSGFCKGRYDVIDIYKKDTNGYSSYVDILGITVCQVKYIRSLIYDKKTSHKKVPQIILNANKEIQKAFYDGYYISDGLKKYNYKSYKSNSPLLIQGLLLIKNGIFTIHTQQQNDRFYYKVDYPSYHTTDKSLYLNSNFVSDKNDYVFDIQTECGYLNAGIGNLIVSNSEIRGENFVTRKISKWIAANIINIRLGRPVVKLKLGNIDAIRDWSYAGDIVDGMYKIINYEKPDDFVLCSGIGHSVRDLLSFAFSHVGINDWSPYVEIDPSLYRPCEVEYLRGSCIKAVADLDWDPKVNFEELVKRIVDNDIRQNN